MDNLLTGRSRPRKTRASRGARGGTQLAAWAPMTITDLQSIPTFQGWEVSPQRRPRLPLSPRERQILDAVLAGRTRKEVAFDLGVANATVRVLYSRAMHKLGRARRGRGFEPAPFLAEPAA